MLWRPRPSMVDSPRLTRTTPARPRPSAISARLSVRTRAARRVVRRPSGASGKASRGSSRRRSAGWRRPGTPGARWPRCLPAGARGGTSGGSGPARGAQDHGRCGPGGAAAPPAAPAGGCPPRRSFEALRAPGEAGLHRLGHRPAGVGDAHRLRLAVAPRPPAAGDLHQAFLLQAPHGHPQAVPLDSRHVLPAQSVADAEELPVRAGAPAPTNPGAPAPGSCRHLQRFPTSVPRILPAPRSCSLSQEAGTGSMPEATRSLRPARRRSGHVPGRARRVHTLSMRILITGGAGFIGSALARAHVQRGTR